MYRLKVGKFSGAPLSPPGSSGGKRLSLPRFSPSVSLSRFPWLQESLPPPLFLRRVGASSPPSCRANSQKFSDFLSNEVMVGSSKVRSTPQEISRPEVLTFPTFDPPTAGSANPSKNYREKQRKFRPSSETKILYNLGTRETAQRRKPLLRAV